MNREDIIAMAKQAGFEYFDEFPEDYQNKLERLAKLVRDDYSNKHADLWLDRIHTYMLAERKRIVNLLMIQHEAAKGSHNYWHVAANLIQAEVASDT